MSVTNGRCGRRAAGDGRVAVRRRARKHRAIHGAAQRGVEDNGRGRGRRLGARLLDLARSVRTRVRTLKPAWTRRLHEASTAWYGVHASFGYATQSVASLGGSIEEGGAIVVVVQWAVG